MDEKLEPRVKVDGDRLTIFINDEKVRSLKPNNHKSYKFQYDNEEYHFIYEKTPQTEKLFFYPMNIYTKRIFNIKEIRNG